MLVFLGFAMIACFMYLVMARKATPIAVLILVPVIFGLFAGGRTDIGDMVEESLLKLAPTAALLFFAILFFCTMIDVGVFDPLIRWILRFAHGDPVRVTMGTALLTSIVSLDGDGSTTFIIVTSAFLPIYRKLGMSPVVLTVIAALSNGVLNTVPWGGSTSRASAALGVSPVDIFVPMIPAILAGVASVLVLAYFLGLGERRRIGKLELVDDPSGEPGAGGDTPASHRSDSAGDEVDDASSGAPAGEAGEAGEAGGAGERAGTAAGIMDRPKARPKLWWVNLALTLTVMVLLVADVLFAPLIFMVAASLALVLNFRKTGDQIGQIQEHAPSVITVVGMIMAASALTGVLEGTGIISEMSSWLVDLIPTSWGPVLATIGGVLSIPFTFLMTNDAFYFGILPILSDAGGHYGIEPVEMARASIVGQALHQSSPLAPSFLLLVGLAGVSIGDHFKKVLWRAVVVALVMLLVGGLTAAFPLL
ncbi:MAG: citrate:proton symporter [Corynebacterium provencense]|jgi:CitMHS family citrate-Mg2+:H+ or citrate-Ca2+:H+ symporter|uniref:CitMHS family transporter n=1 Tax=Corynebacterium provencense TaxID=1737425 RepID=UPI002989F300|nr:citrate:proton symporter [Corynebacterium provencense]